MSVELRPIDAVRGASARWKVRVQRDEAFGAAPGPNLWKADAPAGKLAANRGLADLINVL
ncbi:hypothetical protein [Phenylobacterium sp.]|uniref:hypothetical protein n=1 Tax=Phenylobacterium sp. TaxID=1871053 RepID=UPI003567E869